MTDQNFILYRQLHKFFSEANINRSYSQIDTEVGIIWQKLKTQPEFPGNVHAKIQELKKKAAEGRGKLDAFWVNEV